MLRLAFSYLLILLMLWLSIGCAMDTVAADHQHGAEHTHELAADQLSVADGDHDNKHCQHCCHDHSSSIASNHCSTRCEIYNSHATPHRASLVDHSQAPPNPPPNA